MTSGRFAFLTNGQRQTAVICLTLIVIVFALYSPVANHAFLNYDDNIYVTGNRHVAAGMTGKGISWAFTAVEAGNWHPLTWLSHMLDVELYGMEPRGHHLTSVAIHALATLSLFLLMLRLSGLLWHSSCVAILFAIHPLHVESVAWVAERKDVLSAFFWFLTLLLYAEYTSRQKRAYYLLALASFVLGLMAKPMLVTLPLVMLLLDYWPLNRCQLMESAAGPAPLLAGSRRLKLLLRDKIPFFACAVAATIMTIFAQHADGAIKSLDAIPLPFRVQNALVAYVTYIGNTVWPDDLAILYPIPPSYTFWQVSGSLLVLLLITAATVHGRHRFPCFLAGWLWFLITLLPVIGIIQVGVQAMADRYTYIPSVGLFIMAVWGGPLLVNRWKHRLAVLTLLAGTVMCVNAALTWQQLRYWRDNFSLYERTLAVTADNYVIHNNLGSAYAANWHLEAAIREFRAALRIRPHYSDAHYNLAMALAMKGETETAIREFREALRINPGFSKAAYHLQIALEQKRLLQESGK